MTISATTLNISFLCTVIMGKFNYKNIVKSGAVKDFAPTSLAVEPKNKKMRVIQVTNAEKVAESMDKRKEHTDAVFKKKLSRKGAPRIRLLPPPQTSYSKAP